MKKPVTLITGYLGSGKTTLMNELLRHQDTKGLALIVNDMGSVNVDAEILKKNNNKVSCDTKLIEMQNGCICCTLLVEFMEKIKELAAKKGANAILLRQYYNDGDPSYPINLASYFLKYLDNISQEDRERIIAYVDSQETANVHD